MVVGVVYRPNDPFSLKLYADHVLKQLEPLGAQTVRFEPQDNIPERADLIWEPSIAGSRPPLKAFKELTIPVVVTVHGLRAFVLPWQEVQVDIYRAAKVMLAKWKARRHWSWFKHRVAAIITPSQATAREAAHVFGIREDLFHPIHHGVDHEVFNTAAPRPQHDRPYYLVVSQNNPVKNVKRIFEAYRQINLADKPDLVAIQTGSREKTAIPGIKQITEGVSTQALSDWYKGALALVFPSIHEGFGLPILEAMACGCPVITSNTTACAEVSGDAAIQVEPRSVDAIKQAMLAMLEPGKRKS